MSAKLNSNIFDQAQDAETHRSPSTFPISSPAFFGAFTKATAVVPVEARRQRSAAKHEFLCSLMECIHNTLAQLYPDSHLITCNNQIDNGAKVETFFKRTGYADLLNSQSSDSTLAEDLWEPVSEILLDSENLIRFRLRGQLNWQLRGQMPLQAFVSSDDPSCFQKHLPNSLYRPENFGVEPVESYDFSCLPFTLNKHLSEYLRTVAGYWSDTPFFKGDPCQFGLVGVLDISRNEDLFDDLASSTLLNAAEREFIITRHGLSEGILTAFAWSSAIAYNQGFTLYNDLTYPIPVQLLLTDGHHFQLLRFQLNSLTALWKPEDAGLPFNMAWASQRLALYDQDAAAINDKITINTTALTLIADALLREPMQPNAEMDLRPYLATTTDSADDTLRRRLIPPSLNEEDQLQMSAGTHGEHLDVHLTPAERKALLDAEAISSKRTPLRIAPRRQPHPNDIFFFRPTEKADLLQEFREQMPVFGGRAATLPEPHKQILQEEKKRIRWRRLTDRVQSTTLTVIRRGRRQLQDQFDKNDAAISNLLAEENRLHNAGESIEWRSRLANGMDWTTLNSIGSITMVMHCELPRGPHGGPPVLIAYFLSSASIECLCKEGVHDTFTRLPARASSSVNALSPFLIQRVAKANRTTLLTEKTQLLQRWAGHFRGVLNRPSTLSDAASARPPQVETNAELDLPPFLHNQSRPCNSSPTIKAPRTNAIPAEIYRHSGPKLMDNLTALFQEMWPGKIFVRILHQNLNNRRKQGLLSERRRGVRRYRRTTDMIFTARQLQATCQEMRTYLYSTFVGLANAFDTVDRGGLWKIMQKFSCSERFTQVVGQLYEGTTTCVADNGVVSEALAVINGMIQDCVLTPILCSLMFSARLMDAYRDECQGICAAYRTDGQVFNQRQVDFLSRESITSVHELLFVDDYALNTTSAGEM
nr:unnamed protein product [Spirometra erinaceieuropaei]